MKNKINIAEILKDCPSGMELYSPLVGDCKFVKVHDYESKIIVELETGATVVFQTDGRYFDCPNAECILFPKGKTTWEGFQRPFKNGDIVFYSNTIAIFDEWGDETLFRTYCVLYTTVSNPMYQFEISIPLFGKGIRKEVRFATEEEKAKLFNAIKANGYKWNDETKTLEKLIKPWTIQDAKDGDVLAFNDETIVIFKDLYNKTSFHSYCHIEEGIFTISKKDMPDWWEGSGFYPATEEQRDFLFQKIKEAGYKWNPETKTLEKVFELKFKVGDRVQNKNTNMIGTINLIINDEREYQVTLKNGGITYILFEFQDSWELINEPKFKVDDKIKLKGGDEFGIITQVTDCFYTIKCKNNTHCWPIKKQDDWELVPDIKPKFKVGDRIRNKHINSGTDVIIDIEDNRYVLNYCDQTYLNFKYQDNYELVPSKFDITSLKPFESKVLVRDRNTDKWIGSFYSHCKSNGKKFYTIGSSYYYQCIPYEGNEHLLDTTDDCDEYFKIWE